MACACTASSTDAEPWVIVLPGGRTKSYATQQGAGAALSMYPGSYLKERRDGVTLVAAPAS
jgi:hypothetical protein